MDGFLEAQRIIDDGIQLADGAAVRTHCIAPFRQSIEVRAGGYRRDLEPGDDVFNCDPAIVLENFANLLAAFFR
jgi:hypothetical protein